MSPRHRACRLPSTSAPPVPDALTSVTNELTHPYPLTQETLPAADFSRLQTSTITSLHQNMPAHLNNQEVLMCLQSYLLWVEVRAQ